MPAELNSGPADQVPIGHTFGNGPFGVDLRRRVDIWNSACLRLDDHALRIFDTTETTLLNHAYDFRNHALQKLQWRSMDQLERPTCTGGADRASWSIDTGCSNIGDSIISKTFRDVSLCALQIERQAPSPRLCDMIEIFQKPASRQMGWSHVDLQQSTAPAQACSRPKILSAHRTLRASSDGDIHPPTIP